MHIRRAGITDFNAILRLNRVVQDLHAGHEPGYFRPFDEMAVREHLSASLEDPAVTFLLALDDDKPIGYIMMRVQERPGHAYALPRKFIELEQLAVEPDCQNRGVGGALLDEALAMAKKLDIAGVELSVWQFNDKAQRLFCRKGFEPCLQRMRIRGG